jgi:ABC-type transport system involved in multi-copper enzyme maturation permease subunit
MSTTAYAPPAPGGLSRDARPGLGRLIRVELRKMYDTRAGFWLLLSAVLLAGLTAALTVFTGSESGRTFSNVLDNASQAINVLVPIVGILLVTSEWSQRTAQVTFTLVPQRERVLLAKLGASVVLAVGAFVAALAVSVLFTALGGETFDGSDVWAIDGGVLVQSVLFYIFSMLIGVALGSAILLSAPAVVASFVLPIGLAAVLHLINGLGDIADWTDQSEALSPLTNHGFSGHEWAQALVCLALWFGVPIAIGTWRFLKGEVR